MEFKKTIPDIFLFTAGYQKHIFNIFRLEIIFMVFNLVFVDNSQFKSQKLQKLFGGRGRNG